MQLLADEYLFSVVIKYIYSIIHSIQFKKIVLMVIVNLIVKHILCVELRIILM